MREEIVQASQKGLIAFLFRFVEQVSHKRVGG